MLAVEVGGNGAGEFGQLAVGDQALLAGTVSLKLVNGYHPAVGTQLEIVTANGGFLGSRFDNAIAGDLSGLGVWGIEYSADAVIAELISTTQFGDLTGDGQLTAADWSAFKSGQGLDFSGMTLLAAYSLGDLNGDGEHDLLDFSKFRAAYEESNGAGSFARMLTGVPEPSAAFLACLLLVGATTIHYRQQKAG
jgi:hypothetical protein